MRRFARLGLLAGFAVCSAVAGAADYKAGAITVSAAWSRATFGSGATGIAFMTIDNAGPPDALISVSCEGAQVSSLHDEKSGTMAMPGMSPMRTDSMPLLDQIPLPAKSRVVLKPGRLHVMMYDMDAALTVGQAEPCVLHFRNAGPLNIILKVGRAGASTPPK